MNTLKSTLNSSINECDAHIFRMNTAYDRLKVHLPLKGELFPLEDEVAMSFLDQFLLRFIKLQDSMAHRLCPPLFGLLENTVDSYPFIDVLNRLEKYSVLSSVDSWQYFRNLRNNMTHEYPENLEQNVENLNLIFSNWRELEELYLGLKKASSRFL